MQQHDRRKNTRVNFHTTATLKFPDTVFAERETRDLSVKDVFVIGVVGRNMGEHCEVEINLSGMTSDLCLWMKGEIVRIQDDGVALRFYEIDLDSFYHLKNIVYYNTENPDAIIEKYVEDMPDNEFEDQ